MAKSLSCKWIYGNQGNDFGREKESSSLRLCSLSACFFDIHFVIIFSCGGQYHFFQHKESSSFQIENL
jgi:hypothetical protein